MTAVLRPALVCGGEGGKNGFGWEVGGLAMEAACSSSFCIIIIVGLKNKTGMPPLFSLCDCTTRSLKAGSVALTQVPLLTSRGLHHRCNFAGRLDRYLDWVGCIRQHGANGHAPTPSVPSFLNMMSSNCIVWKVKTVFLVLFP